MKANIEIKPFPGTTAQTTTIVLSQIHQQWPRNKPLPLLSSFDWDALTLCRQFNPDIPLGLLMHVWDPAWEKKADDLNAYSIHLSYQCANAARIRDIKSKGYRVFIYTVNQPRQAKKLRDLGVDGIFSDYPDLLR